jgi:hypothetical protein
MIIPNFTFRVAGIMMRATTLSHEALSLSSLITEI